MLVSSAGPQDQIKATTPSQLADSMWQECTHVVGVLEYCGSTNIAEELMRIGELHEKSKQAWVWLWFVIAHLTASNNIQSKNSIFCDLILLSNYLTSVTSTAYYNVMLHYNN